LFARADLSEDAAQSRWQLLPKLWEKIQERPWRGHGFGATVMYTTKDPRIVQKTGGSFTTYIFEWGWLDSWIKFGVLGIPVLLGWLLWLGWRASRIFGDQSQIQWGIYLSLLVFVVVHAFTPYLNHPLGIGFLLFIEGFLTLHEFERRQLIATAKTV
jgi:O-antigen ligase